MHTRDKFYFKYGIVEIKLSVDAKLSDKNDPTVIQIGLYLFNSYLYSY